MKNITVVNFKGNTFSGSWNGKTYKSTIEGRPELLRIYVDNKGCHITPDEYKKIGGDPVKDAKEKYIEATREKLEDISRLLDDPAVKWFFKKNGMNAFDIQMMIKNNEVTAPNNLK
jgi:hypothetical protein